MNQNRLYPYYLVYIQQDGTIVYDYTKAKHLLDLARLACRDKSIPIPTAYEPFNRKTKDGREMKRYSELLDTVIENIRNVKAEKDIDSLFNGLNTTALIDDIQSLSDFELISFIVIEDAV